MSHHSGLESDQKDLTKSIHEAVLNKDGGNVTIKGSKIYIMTAGGDIGDIKHEGSGETFNVMKMANNGGSITANEYDTRSTIAVQTPPGNTSAEGSPSTSGRTRRKRKAKKNRSTSPSRTPKRRGSDNSKNKKEGIQLSDSIWCFSELRLAKKAKVFAGVQKSKALSEQQQLAIKLIWQYTEKNRREAENLLKLKSHTNVVGIVHADVYEAEPGVECLYIAMERCDTLNLEDYIEKRKSKNVPFNPIEAFEHAKQVIAGIDHIHGRNILHRDLKPSNVLFSLCGRYLKICDFGLSKELRNGLSMTGLSTLKATMDGYRAPETYNENVISKMADIFSLALVLYHLLSYGFHPFGIHPTSWCYNIQNGQGLDLSRLRVPFLKIVRELLEKMLNFKPKSRLKIGQVKKNESMKLDWFPLITESLVPIWNGVVKDRKGADMLSCRLYRSPSLQDAIKIDESGWKFEMDTVRYFDIGSLKTVTDEEPSGYIVTSKDELQRLTDKLAGNLMGWIDISKYGKESKVIVLLSKPGYPELFGYFFPDTKIMTSLFGNLASRQRSTPQKPVAGLDTHPLASAYPPSNLQAQASEPSSTSAEPAPVSSGITSGIVDQDSTKEQEAAPAADQCKETSSGLIPWWIYTGDLQK